jgi:pimeloyl-ACP methyl ester carboxylesterase
MEPRIQYATTSDGVSIAYWTLGEGPPLVHNAPAFPHLQLEWQIPKIRAWYERLAQKRKLIRYDMRGTGLSQREIPYSPESLVLDLEPVVDRLVLDTFALLGTLNGGQAAITYAARNPERVSQLILWCTYSRAADWTTSPQIQAVRALMDKDWDTYAETAAHVLFGWSAGDEARAFATLIRESTTPEALHIWIRAMSEVDVTALLPHVQSPTLVLHRRQVQALGVDVVMRLASRIPQARLVILEGTALMPYLDDMESVRARRRPRHPLHGRRGLHGDDAAPGRREGARRHARTRAHHPRVPARPRRLRGQDDGRRLHGLVRLSGEGAGVRHRRAESLRGAQRGR